MTPLSPCPGCGAEFPASDGPTHAYLGASAGCWEVYGQVLAKEFEDARLFAAVHQFTVDAYAAQHPGKPERRAIQSVAVHLAGLHLALDLGRTPEKIIAARKAMTKADFVWLDPPEAYTMTVLDVAGAEDFETHVARVRTWAEAVWQAWAPHHETVREWAGEV